MNRRRAKRAESYAARNRAAADERRAAAAAEERRAAVAAAEERRAAAAAAEELRPAAAVAPPLPVGPAVPAPAAPERLAPTSEQLYKSLYAKPNPNHVSADKIKRRQGLPLPPRAAPIEAKIFELKKEDKTGKELVDIVLKDLYEDSYNDIGDKRREILHCIWKSDGQKEIRLSEELNGLMSKVNRKIKELADSTGHLITLPEHFLKYPALRK